MQRSILKTVTTILIFLFILYLLVFIFFNGFLTGFKQGTPIVFGKRCFNECKKDDSWHSYYWNVHDLQKCLSFDGEPVQSNEKDFLAYCLYR
jgi:hypothetical protein